MYFTLPNRLLTPTEDSLQIPWLGYSSPHGRGGMIAYPEKVVKHGIVVRREEELFSF